LAQVGGPAVVKTTAFGYDGKGQHKAGRQSDLARIWEAVARQEVVVERLVSLQAEISVIAARGLDGAIVEYAAFENRHHNHILDVTTTPAAVPPAIAARARDITRT